MAFLFQQLVFVLQVRVFVFDCVFCLLTGQGHAADGEVGGGDGPQTCHGGVSD